MKPSTSCLLILVLMVTSTLSKPKCGPNEIYATCGPSCYPTCANKNPGPFCTDECIVGCFCNGGFLRKQGKCVPKDEC
ncbi:hypothetical protein Zmor_018788 [Zophobas morio]|uniref:TIL domain-containing protein n=1 Tax=Zophobas morio TaxID=2755281 RepID=A0AA38I801_9CUCU|nr:hypothetical protein Zmor_018788 [Zophobas morio]